MDEQIKEQVTSMLHKPWVQPTITGVLGFAVGVGSAYLYFKREVKQVIVSSEEDINRLQEVQLELNFERAEKDHEFNAAIGDAALVTRELRNQGVILLERLQALSDQSQQLPQTEPEEEEQAEIEDENGESGHPTLRTLEDG